MKRLLSDRPIGASGGLDSSLVLVSFQKFIKIIKKVF